MALAAFVVAERRSADPMMDLTLFRDRTYSLAIGTIFAVLFAVYGMLLVITQYLQNVRGFSPTQAGLIAPALQRDVHAGVAARRESSWASSAPGG